MVAELLPYVSLVIVTIGVPTIYYKLGCVEQRLNDLPCNKNNRKKKINCNY